MSDELFSDASWLIGGIARALDQCEAQGTDEVLRRLADQDLSESAMQPPAPRTLPACRYLTETVAGSMMVSDRVAAALAACAPHLHWKQNANYSDALLGDGYMDNYCYAEIIGPTGFFPGADFLLGLMILGPERHYLEHFHPAPELYWTLSGLSWWRRGSGPFELFTAGSTIWHAPNEPHATRTGDAPLLALWCWTRDVDQSARLMDQA